MLTSSDKSDILITSSFFFISEKEGGYRCYRSVQCVLNVMEETMKKRFDVTVDLTENGAVYLVSKEGKKVCLYGEEARTFCERIRPIQPLSTGGNPMTGKVCWWTPGGVTHWFVAFKRPVGLQVETLQALNYESPHKA
jgi:hypothetical protein